MRRRFLSTNKNRKGYGMFRDLKIRFGIIILLIVGAFFALAPSVNNELPDWWKDSVHKVKLGLDLQGGMHLILEVQAKKAVESFMERTKNDVESYLKSKGILVVSAIRKGLAVQIKYVKSGKEKESAASLLTSRYPELKIVKSSQEEGHGILVLELSHKRKEAMERAAVDQALETIRNRIDQFGVSEPDISRQGKDRILVQLPGIKNPQRAIELIGKTAMLEFKLVDDGHSLEDALKGNIPPGDEILYQRIVDPDTGTVTRKPYLIKKKTLLTGDVLKDAQVRINTQYGEPYVSITFDSRGAEIFEKITAENVKKRLAIILDNNVYSAPVIQERIAGGRAQITGRFTTQEAHDLAIVLRAGALPAPVKILEKRTVGPTLGQDSIRRGITSVLIGGLLVIVFMIFYYKLSGIIADLALFLNVIFIFAVLAAFRATLTLPGIAGIVLTIGMAVDANVLIFERIREELRLGKTPRASMEAGFAKAFITIMDANVTTLIAAIVLFQFGTGPIKGFAVTLSIGIISSMFTAIFVSRSIFDFAFEKRRIRQISI